MEGEGKSGATQWTTSQSSFVQTYLINLVFEGNKTSTGFKKVHLNGCAKALNDHFKINRTADQISNHLKTLKKNYSRINYLRNLSRALWDEDQFILSFDHEHYTNYFEDTRNKVDDEFINKPLPYYANLATIFGNSVATRQFVRTSNESLYAEVGDNSPKDGIHIGGSSSAVNPTEIVSSSGNGTSKRAKKDAFKNDDNSVDGLVQTIDRGTQTLATLADAIKEAALVKTTKKALLEGLFEEVDNLPGFKLEHKSKYYAHLVGNPDIATASLPLLYKITWITTFVNKRC